MFTTRNDGECCGTCKHHTPPDYCNGENGDWVCSCDRADEFACETEYDHKCEEWEARK
ncbi:MAG: hypothetical protein IJ711_00395 [Lachnospiraceae bacterium]|nr:hypothetical protein [Clostridia bacterium]MBR1691215.1 hypothetical protein [Lachnospiraceae bacterium]